MDHDELFDRSRERKVLAGEVRWGKWCYDPELMVLTHEDTYEVDLERMDDSASVLDWIAQVACKECYTEEDVGHLVRAINELMHLQATCCSMGRDKSFDPREVLRRPALAPV